MANLNFFGTRPDLERVFAFIYGDTDFRVFESYSEFGQQLREFPSFAALANAYDLGNDLHGNGTAALLQLWSPTVMAKPVIERIKLIPHKCNGFTFRYRITGFGLVQLYLGGVHEQVVTKTHYGHFSERGAAQHGDVRHVNWQGLKQLSGRFQRHIGRKLAVAKAPGRQVLPGAFAKFQAGFSLKEAAQVPYSYTAVPVGST